MSLSAGRVGVRADQVDSHGRVISPSFLNEIMEDLPEWTDLPVRVNGTEELIPSNPSVPVTSPILADIDYPDVRRNNQYFTYRESPTPVDGLAKIKSIKGNTLVWNQLVDTNTSSVTLTSGHKFITKVGGTYSLVNGTGQSLSVTGGTDEVFDLTKMGIDSITSADEFNSLFPLPYYSYESGKLLSFNGTGIKVVGFNQWDEEWKVGDITTINGTETAGTKVISKNYCPMLPSTTYYINSTSEGNMGVFFYDSEQNYIGMVWKSNNTFVSPSNARYFKVRFPTQYGSEYKGDECINISDTSKNGEYEPYTENTTNLPTLTYFPNGMNGVPYSSSNPTIVYDELIGTKAIKRTNKVIYDGSNDEKWNLQSINSYNIANFSLKIDDYVPSIMNSSKCNIFTPQVSMIAETQTEGYLLTYDKALYIRISSSKASTVEQFRTWLASNNIEFVYRLATPVELPTLDFGE